MAIWKKTGKPVAYQVKKGASDDVPFSVVF